MKGALGKSVLDHKGGSRRRWCLTLTGAPRSRILLDQTEGSRVRGLRGKGALSPARSAEATLHTSWSSTAYHRATCVSTMPDGSGVFTTMRMNTPMRLTRLVSSRSMTPRAPSPWRTAGQICGQARTTSIPGSCRSRMPWLFGPSKKLETSLLSRQRLLTRGC